MRSSRSTLTFYPIPIIGVIAELQTTEVCTGETQEIRCHSSQILTLTSAWYGQMHLGRCVQLDLGYLGCGADILQHADGLCSGLPACSLTWNRVDMDRRTGLPCPRELAAFVEVKYQCVSG